jgi:hypothetical protein
MIGKTVSHYCVLEQLIGQLFSFPDGKSKIVALNEKFCEWDGRPRTVGCCMFGSMTVNSDLMLVENLR